MNQASRFPQDLKLIGAHPNPAIESTIVQARDQTIAYVEGKLTLEKDEQIIHQILALSVNATTAAETYAKLTTSIGDTFALQKELRTGLRAEFGFGNTKNNDPARNAIEASLNNFGLMLTLLLESRNQVFAKCHEIQKQVVALGVYRIESGDNIFSPRKTAAMSADDLKFDQNLRDLEIARMRFVHDVEGIDVIARETGFTPEAILSKGMPRKDEVFRNNPMVAIAV